MKFIPEKLNNHLIAISVIGGCYAGFKWHNGGGYVWRFIIGVCGYMFVAGLYQVWATRKN